MAQFDFLVKEQLVDLVIDEFHFVHLLPLAQEGTDFVSLTHEVRASKSEVAIDLALAMPNPDLRVAENQEVIVIDHSTHRLGLFLILLRVVLEIIEQVILKVGQRKEDSFLVHQCLLSVFTRVVPGYQVVLGSFDNDDQIGLSINELMKNVLSVSRKLVDLVCSTD